LRIGPLQISFTSQPNARATRLREFGSGSIQQLGDLLLQLEAFQSDSNNKYVTREMQVDETLRKYRGQAVKGNILLGNILETRSAFTAGRGLNYVWEGEAEQQFIQQFFAVNKIKLAFIRQLARERGFEGQVLLVLQPHADRVPRVRFLSWWDSRYEVIASANDYTMISRVERPQGEDIPAARIAFMRFNTRLNSMQGKPLFAGILDKLEDLDDALIRLKTANKSASNPTPYWQFQDENDAETFRQFLAMTGWKMGQALAGAGTPTMIQMGYGSYTALTEEVTTLAKIISGHTSVPPHYFGFPELVGNRAVADDMSTAFVQIAETETEEWQSGFTDLIGKAMALYNEWSGSKLNTMGGEAMIEVISEEDFRRIAAIWLPLWLGGAITTETFLAKVPTINEAEEAAKVMEEMMRRGIDLGLGKMVTPGEVVPPERKVALDALKTYGNTRSQ
jgi:hypothetical protein